MTTNLEPTCLPTVLCVDDEPAVLHALERVLKRYGCRVLLVEDGYAALQRLSQEHVDVLICDEAMPGMPGTDLLRRAKAIAPRTIRILLTGRCGDQAVVMRAVNSGEVFRLLAKPWDDDELRQAVTDAIGAEPEAWRRQRQRTEQRLESYGTAAGGKACSRPAVAADPNPLMQETR